MDNVAQLEIVVRAREVAKAIVALFAPVLTYVAGQLAQGEPVHVGLAASFAITAVLVWAVPNTDPR